MRDIILFICNILIASSCSTEKTVHKMGNGFDEFRTYSINISKEATPYHKLIDHVEVIQLEETPEAQVGNVYLISTNDSSIVIVNNKQDFLFVYASEGRFLGKIDRLGSGPEEYSYIGDVWLEEGNVTLYDRRKRRLFSYDLAGNFKYSTEKLKESATHIFPSDKGYVLDTDYGLIADTIKAKLLFLDNDLLPVATALPFSQSVGFSAFDGFNVFQYDGKYITYQAYLSDTVYKLVGHNAEPYFSIDIGDDWFWNHYSVFDNPAMVYNKMQTSEMPSRLMVSSGREHLYIKALNGKIEPHFIVNRNSHKYEKISYSHIKVTQVNPLTSRNGKFLFSVSSDQVSQFLSPLQQGQVHYLGAASLDEIESSENPVLMWVKFNL